MRRPEQDFLMAVKHQNRIGNTCLITSRIHRRATADRLVESGHVVGRQCVMVDGDGFTKEPERWVTGFELTELGEEWLSNMKPGPNGYDARKEPKADVPPTDIK